MTHLRKIMLEELQRRNYAESTFKPTFARWNTSATTSIVHLISSDRNIFASLTSDDATGRHGGPVSF